MATPRNYVHVRDLGHGATGRVDEVKDAEGNLYARKTISLGYFDRAEKEKQVRNEVDILRKLRNKHIISIQDTYRYGSWFSIIMLPVADYNLAEHLYAVDKGNVEPLGLNPNEYMFSWPSCLIVALDYLHEMRIRHKDLKPQNILVRNYEVIIADFGIARDLANQTTTGTRDTVGPHTPIYSAPEVISEPGSRRGRSSDVFSLGCIILEILSCLVPEAQRLDKFNRLRLDTGDRAYASCPLQVLQWIEYLLFWDFTELFGGNTPMHPFLMLDPDPKTRITSRQLLSLNGDLALHGCPHYGVELKQPTTHLPQHSQRSDVTLNPELYVDDDYEPILRLPFSSWEEPKRKWLSEHMWW